MICHLRHISRLSGRSCGNKCSNSCKSRPRFASRPMIIVARPGLERPDSSSWTSIWSCIHSLFTSGNRAEMVCMSFLVLPPQQCDVMLFPGRMKLVKSSQRINLSAWITPFFRAPRFWSLGALIKLAQFGGETNYVLGMVNFPKKKNTYCKKCVKHQPHTITWQKKAGKNNANKEKEIHVVF